MPNYRLLLYLAAIIFCYSCKGTEKTKVQPAYVSTNATEAVVTPTDVDQYYMVSLDTVSSHGPTSITRNVLQDSKGDMWMATWEGIMHYDGQTFTNHMNKDSLRKYRTFSLLEDSKGILWFGTIGAGVYRYDGHVFTNIDTTNGLVNNDVGCIYEDKNGLLWFGTRVGVSRYDGKTLTNFTTDDGLSDNDINAIAEDVKGNLWFAARGAASMYDGKTFTKITREDGAAFYNARSVIKDHRGHMWLGGNDGLWSYDGQSYVNYTKSFIGNIFEDTKGQLWVSRSSPKSNYGMSLIKYIPGPLPSREVSETFILDGYGQVFGATEDRDGNIWFGLEIGIARYDGKDFEYFR